jgi:hypothetical protein
MNSVKLGLKGYRFFVYCPEPVAGSNGAGSKVPFFPLSRISTFFSTSSSFWLQRRERRIPSSKSLRDSSRGISPSSSFETIFSSLLRESSNLSLAIRHPTNSLYIKRFAPFQSRSFRFLDGAEQSSFMECHLDFFSFSHCSRIRYDFETRKLMGDAIPSPQNGKGTQ